MNFSDKHINFINECEKEVQDIYKRIENVSFFNQKKVIEAFKKNCVALRHFSGTTGYGYGDVGRETLDRLVADIFKTESAILSPHILSGTHAITIALFGLLRPNDVLLSVSGLPYSTLRDVIFADNKGSLKDFGVKYNQIDLIDNDFDYEMIKSYLTNNPCKVCYIQRSRGYEFRQAIKIEQIEKLTKFVKAINKDCIIVVDNCYGEFVCKQEPSEVGADVVIGSMIKNIGGGIAPTGGYIAGTELCIEQISYRLTTSSVGREIGSYQNGYQQFFQGLFLAPHVTAQALKGMVLLSKAMQKLGYETLPSYDDEFSDIVCSIVFKTEQELVKFCQNVQYVSPIDSFVTPEAWDMPGYDTKVIMAAGCFVEGASIELSADSPIKEPYIAYVQGGLTYEHIKLAALNSIKDLLE